VSLKINTQHTLWERIYIVLSMQREIAVQQLDLVSCLCVCLLLQDLVQSCLHGGGVVVFITAVPNTWDRCVCLLLQYLIQRCARGGRRIVEDMCYEIRRAEACVD
jgi:hypothetical protein